VFEALGKETTGTAPRIVDGIVHLGVDDLDHCLDDLPWCEELAAVVALLAHLRNSDTGYQQQNARESCQYPMIGGTGSPSIAHKAGFPS